MFDVMPAIGHWFQYRVDYYIAVLLLLAIYAFWPNSWGLIVYNFLKWFLEFYYWKIGV